MSYQTKSLAIAAYLYSKSEITMDGVNKSDPDNILFIFSPDKIAEQLVDNYYTANGDNGNIKRYVEAEKSLKDLIFEIKRQRS
jgi:hypothetical protein